MRAAPAGAGESAAPAGAGCCFITASTGCAALHPWLQPATPLGLRRMQPVTTSGLKALYATTCNYFASMR